MPQNLPSPSDVLDKPASNGTKLPSPDELLGKKKAEVSVEKDGGTDLNNGLPTSQSIEAPITDFGASKLLQPQQENVVATEEVSTPEGELFSQQDFLIKKGLDSFDKNFNIANSPERQNKNIQEGLQVLQQNPNDDVAIYKVGYGNYEIGKLDAAESFWQQALKVNPNNTNAKLGIANIDSKKGNYLNAVNGYDAALKDLPQTVIQDGKEYYNPKYFEALQGKAQAQKDLAGTVKSKQEKMDLLFDAQDNINKALKILPNDVRTNVTKAYIEAEYGNDEDAKKAMTDAQMNYAIQYQPVRDLYQTYREQQATKETRPLSEQIGSGLEDISAATGGLIGGALNLPEYIGGNVGGIYEGGKMIGEGVDRALAGGRERNPKEYLTGIFQAVEGGLSMALAAAMLTPQGYLFTQGINAGDTYTNGFASKILMAPIRTLIPTDDELFNTVAGVADVLVTLGAFRQAHKALRGETNPKLNEAVKKLKNGEKLTGEEIKLLAVENQKALTPENLKTISDAAEAIPKDTPQEKVADLTGQLAAIPKELMIQMEGIAPEKKIEIAPLLQDRRELVKKIDAAAEPLKEGLELQLAELDGRIRKIAFGEKKSGITSNVPEPKTKTQVTEEGGVRTELPVNDVPIVPETIERTVTENIQTDLPKTTQDAIQKPEATESMLRNEGIRREGELPGVVERNQPEVTTEVSSEVKQPKGGDKKNIEDRPVWNNTGTKFNKINDNEAEFIGKDGKRYKVSINEDGIEVHNEKGEKSGWAVLSKYDNGDYKIIGVSSKVKRAGIATAMYDFTDSNLGKVRQSAHPTEEGSAFWDANKSKQEPVTTPQVEGKDVSIGDKKLLSEQEIKDSAKGFTLVTENDIREASQKTPEEINKEFHKYADEREKLISEGKPISNQELIKANEFASLYHNLSQRIKPDQPKDVSIEATKIRESFQKGEGKFNIVKGDGKQTTWATQEAIKYLKETAKTLGIEIEKIVGSKGGSKYVTVKDANGESKIIRLADHPSKSKDAAYNIETGKYSQFDAIDNVLNTIKKTDVSIEGKTEPPIQEGKKRIVIGGARENDFVASHYTPTEIAEIRDINIKLTNTKNNLIKATTSKEFRDIKGKLSVLKGDLKPLRDASGKRNTRLAEARDNIRSAEDAIGDYISTKNKKQLPFAKKLIDEAIEILNQEKQKTPELSNKEKTPSITAQEVKGKADTKAVDEVISEPLKSEANEKAKETKEADVLTPEKVTEVSATTEPPLAEQKKFTEKAKKLADKIRSLKTKPLELKDENGNPLIIQEKGFDFNPIIDKIADAVERGGELADAINDALKDAKWFQGLTDKGKDAVKKQLEDRFSESVSGIKHEATKETREEFGLSDYEKTKKTDAELEVEADKLIKEGFNVENFLDAVQKGHEPTDLDYVVIKKYKPILEEQIRKNPSDENLDHLHNLVKVLDVEGTKTGRQFRQRQGLDFADDSLAGFYTRERTVNQDAPLTDFQKERVQKEFDEIEKAKAEWEADRTRLEDENAKLKAEAELKKQKATTKQPKEKRTHADYVAERKEIGDSIKDKIKKFIESTQKTGAIFDPLAEARKLHEEDKILRSIIPDVGRLAESYLKEGVDKLGDIVKGIHDIVKESLPSITEKDIHDIIAGEYAEKKKPKNEIAKTLFELKQEAQAVNKLERLNARIEPKNEKAKQKKNREVDVLRKQIKEHDLTKLAEYKKRTQAQIEKLEEDLKTGNFEKPEKKAPLKLDKEAKEKRDKLIKLKQEREVRLMQQEYANRNKYQRAADKVIDVLNVPRTIMSSMDFSAPLRQGIVASIANPRIASKAFVEMFKQAVSQKRFDAWFHDVKDHPRYEMSREAGLYVADPHDPRLTAKEEAFMNNLAEKIPGAGRFIKGSERAYVGYLNKLRWDIFNRFADQFESSGRTFENSPELYKGIADYINNSTGRGNLGKLESIAPILNTGLFAPRLIASRLNLLNPMYYAKLPKEVRVQALKDMAKFIGLGMTVIALADLAGAEVEKDARSSDFGKIKVGNTRWDIWGGFQQYIRIITQLMTGQSKSANTGNVNELSGQGAFGRTRGDVALSFARGKLAPIPSIGADLLAGRTIMGEDITLAKEAESHLLPLLYGDVKNAMKDNGVQAIFSAGVPAMFGVGVQTYLPRGYEDVDKKDSTYKFLYEKKLNLTTPNQGEMSDEDYKKFIPERKKAFKEEWDTVLKYGAHINDEGTPTVDEDATKLKPVSELTQDELSELMKSISGKATREAKKQFEEPKKPKSNANAPTTVR